MKRQRTRPYCREAKPSSCPVRPCQTGCRFAHYSGTPRLRPVPLLNASKPISNKNREGFHTLPGSYRLLLGSFFDPFEALALLAPFPPPPFSYEAPWICRPDPFRFRESFCFPWPSCSLPPFRPQRLLGAGVHSLLFGPALLTQLSHLEGLSAAKSFRISEDYPRVFTTKRLRPIVT